MRTWIKYVLIEWKLLYRSMLFWILLLSVTGIFYLSTLIQYRINDLGWYVSNMLYIYLSALFLIAQFLSVATARRDITTKTHAIHRALPYHTWQVISARMIALIIPFSLFALIPAGFYLIKGIWQGYAFSTLSTGLAVLCTYVIPLAFTVVLSYWIGTWTSKRISYLISFAIVLAFIIFARLLFSIFIPVHWVHLVDMGLTDLVSLRYFSELWGFMVDGTLWMHRLLYIGIILIIFCGVIWSLMLRRHETKGRTGIISVIGTASLVCIIAIVNYASIWQERNAHYESQISFYEQELVRENPYDIQKKLIEQFLSGEDMQSMPDHSSEMSLEDIQVMLRDNYIIGNPLSEAFKNDLLLGEHYRTLAALSYDLEVTIGSHHMLNVEAELQLSHGHEQPFDRIPLSLRHVFEVDSVKIDGLEVEYAWEPYKDVIWIEATTPLEAGQVYELNISYAGQVDEWLFRKSYEAPRDHWERRVFVADDKLFLPAFYGWYPQPGNQRLTEYERNSYSYNYRASRIAHEIRENAVSQYPADFRVIVKTDHQMTIASNGTELSRELIGHTQQLEFVAHNSDGFNLIGGNIAKWTAKQGHTELSVILSDQIAKAKAKEIADSTLAHYLELTKIIQLLNPEVHFPAEITIARADYPGAMDYRIDGGSINTLPQHMSANSMFYLPYMTHPSRMTQGGDMISFSHEMINHALFSKEDLAGNGRYLKYYLLNMIAQYVSRTIYPEDTPLFDPQSHRSGGGPNPIYMAMNTVYEATGHAGFVHIIQEAYGYLRQFKDDDAYIPYTEINNKFIDFMKSQAGDML